jgi:TonB family protein
VELFPRGVLEGAAGGKEDREWGGKRRYVGDGRAPPDRPDGEEERETVQRRVEDFLAQAAGQERARSGNVGPRWRDFERRVRAGFKPGLEVVKERNVVTSYLDQVKAVVTRGEDGLRKGVTAGSHEPESGIDRSFQGVYGVPEGSNYRSMPMQQAMAAQAETGAPAKWWMCEVEAVVDPDGTLVSVRVVVPSGRRKLDQSAVAAVKSAIEGQGPIHEGKRMISRWAVGAALQVAPPTAIGFGFDESLKTFDFVYPLRQRVLTRVSLVSISAAR